MKADTIVVEETEEQAVRAIAMALEYLRREADAVGMPEVSKLIGEASRISGDFSPPS